MSTRRKFNFPLATLTASADLLAKALTDPARFLLEESPPQRPRKTRRR